MKVCPLASFLLIFVLHAGHMLWPQMSTFGCVNSSRQIGHSSVKSMESLIELLMGVDEAGRFRPFTVFLAEYPLEVEAINESDSGIPGCLKGMDTLFPSKERFICEYSSRDALALRHFDSSSHDHKSLSLHG
jgi:hypothetical protein